MNKDPTGEYPDAYFVGYIFYIIYAVLFALVCVFLVRMFAPYACGKKFFTFNCLCLKCSLQKVVFLKIPLVMVTKQ